MGKSLLSIPHLALFFIVSILLPITRGDLVDDTCKSTPVPEVCISVLRAEPRSSDADVAGLALIVVVAIEAKSKSIINDINELIVSNPSLKDPLSLCAENYNAILIGDIPQAKAALTEGDPKFAEGGVVDAGYEAISCEDSFDSSETPLTDSNNFVRDLSLVAEAIIKLLL